MAETDGFVPDNGGGVGFVPDKPSADSGFAPDAGADTDTSFIPDNDYEIVKKHDAIREQVYNQLKGQKSATGQELTVSDDITADQAAEGQVPLTPFQRNLRTQLRVNSLTYDPKVPIRESPVLPNFVDPNLLLQTKHGQQFLVSGVATMGMNPIDIQKALGDNAIPDEAANVMAHVIKYPVNTARGVLNTSMIPFQIMTKPWDEAHAWMHTAVSDMNRLFDRADEAVLPQTVTQMGGQAALKHAGASYEQSVKLGTLSNDPDYTPRWLRITDAGLGFATDMAMTFLASKGLGAGVRSVFAESSAATTAAQAARVSNLEHKAIGALFTLDQVGNFKHDLVNRMIQPKEVVDPQTGEKKVVKGLSAQEAEDKANYVAMVYAPASWFLNTKLNPATLAGVERSTLNRVSSNWDHYVASIGLGAAQGGLDAASRNGAIMLNAFATKSDMGGTLQPGSDVLRDIGHSLFMGGLGGALLSTFETLSGGPEKVQSMTDIEEHIRSQFKVQNAFERKDLMSQAMLEFTLPPQQARDAVNIQDSLNKVYAKNRGIGSDEAYGEVFANRVERGDIASQVLYQRKGDLEGMFWKTEQILGSDEFQSVAGKNGAPASEVRNYLKNKLTSEELKWSGLQGFLDQAMQPQESSEGDTNKPQELKRLKSSDVMKAFLDRRVMFAQQTLPNDTAGHYQILADELDKQHEVVANAIEDRRNHLAQLKQQGLSDEQIQQDKKYLELDTNVSTERAVREQMQRDIRSLGDQQKDTQYSTFRPRGDSDSYEEWLVSTPKYMWEVIRDDKYQIVSETKPGDQKPERIEAAGVPEFQAPHFGDEGNDLLLHVRADQRSVSHEKGQDQALFVVEAQSDRQQLAKAFEKIADVPQKINKLKAELTNLWSGGSTHEFEASKGKEFYQLDKQTRERAKALTDEIKQLSDQQDELTMKTEGVEKPPEAPFKNNWPELAAKFSLVQAVQRGLRVVAIPSGKLNSTYEGAMSERARAGREYFYDEILPKTFEKVLKKYDKGAKLESGKVGNESKFGTLHVEHDPHVDRYPFRVVDEHGLDLDGYNTREEAQNQVDLLNDLQNNDSSIGSVKFLRISDDAAQKIAKLGFSYFQQNRAATFHFNNGKILYQALEKPDVGSLLHEIMHGLRLSLMPHSDVVQLEKMYGVQDGKWSVENHERFVKDALTYLSENRPPSPQTVGTFERLSEQLKVIYKNAAESEIANKINDDFRGLMDRQFALELKPVQALEQISGEYKQKIKLAEQQLRDLNKPNKDDEQSDMEIKISLARDLEERVGQLKTNLAENDQKVERARQSRYVPNEHTLPEKRYQEIKDLEDLKYENNDKITGLNKFESVAVIRDWLYSTDTALKGLPMYDFLKSKVDNMITRKRNLKGPFNAFFREILLQMPKEVRNQLNEGKDGFGGLRWMFDQKGVPDKNVDVPPQLQKMVNGFQLLFDVESKVLRDLNTLREQPSGDKIPFEPQIQRTLPRLLTPEGWVTLDRKAGPVWEKFVERVAELNGIDLDKANSELQSLLKNVNVKNRTYGHIEGSRTIKFMPDYVEVNDHRYNVFHTDPIEIFQIWLNKTASRTARIAEFGQGMLADVAESVPQMKKVLSIFDVQARPNLTHMKNKLRAGNVPDEFVNGITKKKEAIDTAKRFGVSLDFTAADLIGRVHDLSHLDLTKLDDPQAAEQQLRDTATRLGGIDSKTHIADVLNEIKNRLTNHVEDKLADKLGDIYKKAGGDIERFQRMWKDLEGYPRVFWEKHGLLRSTYATNQYISTLMVTMAPLLNLFQTTVTLPPAAGVNFFRGAKMLMKAHDAAIGQFHDLREAGMMDGAIPLRVLAGGADSSYRSIRYANNFRDFMAKLGHVQTADYNEVVAYHFAGQLYDMWINRGMKTTDPYTAKMYGRLNDADIATVKSGGSDAVRKKFVQNFIATTQYTTEEPFYTAELQKNPLAKEAVKFVSYMMGMGRQTGHAVGLMRDGLADSLQSIRTGLKTGDPKKFLAGAGYIISMTAWGAGAGMLQQMTQRASRALPLDDDEETWKRVGKAFLDIQTMGISSRVLSPMYNNQTMDNYVWSQFPLLETANSLIATLFGYGKYGNFPMGKRIEEFLFSRTPVAQALRRQIRYFAWPDLQQYDLLRSKVRSWEKKQPGAPVQSATQVDPLNPDYFEVFDQITKNDPQEAMRQAKLFYEKALSQKQDLQKAKDGLHASLMQRRPMNLTTDPSDPKLWRFMATLTQTEKQQAWQQQRRYEMMVDLVAPNFN